MVVYGEFIFGRAEHLLIQRIFAEVQILPKTIFHSFPIDFSAGLFSLQHVTGCWGEWCCSPSIYSVWDFGLVFSRTSVRDLGASLLRCLVQKQHRFGLPVCSCCFQIQLAVYFSVLFKLSCTF